MKEYATIDEYLANFTGQTLESLQKVRQTISAAAPEAKEKISYGIPTFTFHGNLVHFAGYENHIGFYPGATAIEMFSDRLKAYETSKGTIRFKLDQPIPYDLIEEITKFCVEQRQGK